MAAVTRLMKAITMKKTTPITCMFLDIGGVLLTDGWGHQARRRAAAHFELKLPELEERHHLTVETYEKGKLTLAEYLELVVFYETRLFTQAEFRRFLFAQSKAYDDMLELVAQLRDRYRLKVVVVSNEARELNAYRIRKFKLNGLADAFVSSCFVHVSKPDMDIYRIALDIAQAKPEQVVYIENTAMFVEIAESMGIRSVLHTDFKSTCSKLASFGLRIEA